MPVDPMPRPLHEMLTDLVRSTDVLEDVCTESRTL